MGNIKLGLQVGLKKKKKKSVFNKLKYKVIPIFKRIAKVIHEE